MDRIRSLFIVMLALGLVLQGCAVDTGDLGGGGDMGGGMDDLGGGGISTVAPPTYSGGASTGENVPPLRPTWNPPTTSSGNCGPSG